MHIPSACLAWIILCNFTDLILGGGLGLRNVMAGIAWNLHDVSGLSYFFIVELPNMT